MSEEATGTYFDRLVDEITGANDARAALDAAHKRGMEDAAKLIHDDQTEESDGWEWAVVEIFGHRKHAGRTREEERFGAKLLRIDIPLKGNPEANGWETIYYGGSSIFSFALCTKEAAIKANTPWDAPSRYALTAPEEDALGDEF